MNIEHAQLVARNRQLERENSILRTGKPMLSKREAEVYKMIADGMTVSEIAAKVFRSVKTITTYRARLLEKLQLRNNAAITQHAVRNRIITIELLPPDQCMAL